jgi:hypothetical protein
METVNDTRWVLLEEGYPHTVLLTKYEAEVLKKIMENRFRYLEYTLFYDEYYEYTEIIHEN